MYLIWSVCHAPTIFFFFFFNDTATTEIYTLSLHDALPIFDAPFNSRAIVDACIPFAHRKRFRSEEHTSELQSPCNLVCRLLLEKKKNLTQLTQLSTSHNPSLFHPSDSPYTTSIPNVPLLSA